jgi:hypothetical protein
VLNQSAACSSAAASRGGLADSDVTATSYRYDCQYD